MIIYRAMPATQIAPVGNENHTLKRLLPAEKLGTGPPPAKIS